LKPSVVLFGLLAVGLGIAEHVWQGRQIADLRGELAMLHNGPIDARQHSLTPAGGVSQESTAVSHAKWQEADRAHRAAVEAGFATEKVDQAWAAEARRDLRDHVATLLPPSSSLGDIDCHSSMCRMEMVVPDLAAKQRFIQSAFLSSQSRIWKGALFVMPTRPNPDGTLGVVMYLGRPGTSLPG
jgi:hypothetical protein